MTSPTEAPGDRASRNTHPGLSPRPNRPRAPELPWRSPNPPASMVSPAARSRGTRAPAATASTAATAKPVSEAAWRRLRRPRRTSAARRNTQYAATIRLPLASPLLMCAVASWVQATASAAVQPKRALVLVARRSPAEAARVTAVHANDMANGSDTANRDPAMGRARAIPPAVAAALPRLSVRRNAYRPSPASTGCSTTNPRRATSQGSAV